MKADCHIHAVLDGIDWKAALMRHAQIPDDGFIHKMLKTYQAQGYTYLRDGGDRWGAGFRARELAEDYGITYKTPGAPLCKAGHYGSFIGVCYSTINEYTQLVKKARTDGADFIKIMISGLMDFNWFGVLTEPALDGQWIRQLVHIAHEEGFSVMAHANGTEAVLPAAEAGVDSVEHGAYLHEEALWAMKEAKTVWVPTVSTVGNLRGKGRFDDRAVEQILESALENIHRYTQMGGLIAPGSDAGAWSVPHGCDTEEALLNRAGVSPEALQAGINGILQKF
ncbi:MAG: amidohydrolase family protein [Oscillospiraceae bacterium]|nr:amidohydrolase family protein [Oscillospiraceae bacterium]